MTYWGFWTPIMHIYGVLCITLNWAKLNANFGVCSLYQQFCYPHFKATSWQFSGTILVAAECQLHWCRYVGIRTFMSRTFFLFLWSSGWLWRISRALDRCPSAWANFVLPELALPVFFWHQLRCSSVIRLFFEFYARKWGPWREPVCNLFRGDGLLHFGSAL